MHSKFYILSFAIARGFFAAAAILPDKQDGGQDGRRRHSYLTSSHLDTLQRTQLVSIFFLPKRNIDLQAECSKCLSIIFILRRILMCEPWSWTISCHEVFFFNFISILYMKYWNILNQIFPKILNPTYSSSLYITNLYSTGSIIALPPSDISVPFLLVTTLPNGVIQMSLIR